MGCDIFPNWLHLCPLEANLVYAALDPLQQITDPPPPLQFPVHQYRTLGNNVTDLIVQRLRDWRFLMIFHFIGCVTSEPHIGFCVFTLFSLCNNERNEWWKYSDSSVTEQYWTPRVLVRLYFLSNPSLHSCTHLCCCLHPPRTPLLLLEIPSVPSCQVLFVSGPLWCQLSLCGPVALVNLGGV